MTPEKETSKEKPERYVKALNYIADRRREYTLIVDASDENQIWLIDSSRVRSARKFKLSEAELAKLAKPYDFAEVIAVELPSVQDVLNAFWLKGIVTKDDLADVQRVRNALATVIPSSNSFTKYVRED
jgi:hypothetical protein